jgi:hypothetical protein
MNELDTLKHKYQKAVETITNIHMEFLMTPKPDSAWMADQASNFLSEVDHKDVDFKNFKVDINSNEA